MGAALKLTGPRPGHKAPKCSKVGRSQIMQQIQICCCPLLARGSTDTDHDPYPTDLPNNLIFFPKAVAADVVTKNVSRCFTRC